MSGINNYFSNNNIFNGTEIPTQGKFDVGDIIVNIGENAEEEPMWMCIEAGEPGVWKVVGKVEDIDLSGYQEKTDENLATKSKDLVGAINELFQNANNGKALIANVIGEPLNSNDTFSAMSTGINGLLSTFKTNMMKNGITVESSDKFKALIDKIATMVEEGSGSGIQYASGHGNSTSECKVSLNFKPILALVQTGKGMITYLESYSTNSVVYSFYDMYVQVSTLASTGGYVNETGFRFGQIGGASWFNWYAIGVGEEDTTLRDSLASILQEEGVDVTEEDDMASLISKVDSEFDRKNEEIENSGGGLDIISAAELPATGKENQICVITDNPVDNFVITSNLDDIVNNTDTISICQLNDKYDILSFGNKLSIANGNVTTNYYFYKACQGTTRVPTYVYQNNTWNQLTKGNAHIFEQGTYGSDFPSGLNVATGKQTHEFGLCTYAYNYGSYTGICFPQTSDSSQHAWFSTKDPLNFALYENLCMTVISDRVTDPLFNIYVGITENNSYTSGRSSEMISPTTIFKSSLDYDLNENVSFSTHPSTLVFDLSKITRTGRLLIIESCIDRFSTCLITNMWLE